MQINIALRLFGHVKTVSKCMNQAGFGHSNYVHLLHVHMKLVQCSVHVTLDPDDFMVLTDQNHLVCLGHDLSSVASSSGMNSVEQPFMTLVWIHYTSPTNLTSPVCIADQCHWTP